jgi:hypothetical protein
MASVEILSASFLGIFTYSMGDGGLTVSRIRVLRFVWEKKKGAHGQSL